MKIITVPKRVTFILLALMHAGVSTASEAIVSALDRPARMIDAPSKAAQFGVAQAGNNWITVGERGVISLSNDRGQTWRQAQSPTSVGLTAVFFLDDKLGWATGHAGIVLGTHDGGETWQKLLDGKQAAQIYVEWASRQADPAIIEKAQQRLADGADKPFLDIYFSDSQHGIAVGAYGLAYVTRDAGRHWVPLALPNELDLHLYSVRARDGQWLIAGEQGLVLLSGDGGNSFRALSMPYEGSFFTALLPGSGAMVVAGLRGNAFQSRDGGATWRALEVPVKASILSAAENVNNEVLLANQAGTLFKVDGTQLLPVAEKLPPLTGLVMIDDLHYLGTSMEGVVQVQLAPGGSL
ncbi:WD40/YVTN/BNR-like repeat-containing protein [Pseudomonas promysalinigenes]|uniref:WD40/YVTN/BNR-like repeat-containing protein n=1 Tax=Pseudomonas promysalinigenes TaxID=485898 RepID=UPI002718E284